MEKDNEEIKVVEKKSETELEKENENGNEYEPNNIIPLEKEDNFKENVDNSTN